MKDERGAIAEVLLIFGGGEIIEGGVDKMGAVFTGGGLASFQFVAEGHEFVDFGDDAVLFGEGANWNLNVFYSALTYRILTGRSDHIIMNVFSNADGLKKVKIK